MENSNFLIAVETVGRNCAGFETAGYVVTVAHKSFPSVLLTRVGSVAWIEYRHENILRTELVVHDGKGDGRGGEHDVHDCGKKVGAWRVKKTTCLTENDPDRFLFEKYAEEKTYQVSEPDFYPSNAKAFADSSLIIGFDDIEKKKAEIIAETIELAIVKAKETIAAFKTMSVS